MTSSDPFYAINAIGRALWDPRPTKTDLQARQLAVALGYPETWRVVRKLQRRRGGNNSNNNENDNHQDDNDDVVVIVDCIYSGKPATAPAKWFHHGAAMEAAAQFLSEQDNNNDSSSAPATKKSSTSLQTTMGHYLPRQPLYTKGDKVQVLYKDGEWYNAKILKRREYPDGFRYQVQYATSDHSKQNGVLEQSIRRRPNTNTAATDPSNSALADDDDDAIAKARELGFVTGDWKAYATAGKKSNKWKIVSPTGQTFTTKKAAMQVYNATTSSDAQQQDGDPPWRTTGNEYLGRRIKWTTVHRASARRSVSLEQVGLVTGWISETDVDKAGAPGYVSERTGQPARLYHVVFDDNNSRSNNNNKSLHLQPYANYLVESQDLEEFELLECLLPKEEDEDEMEDKEQPIKAPPRKKQKKR